MQLGWTCRLGSITGHRQSSNGGSHEQENLPLGCSRKGPSQKHLKDPRTACSTPGPCTGTCCLSQLGRYTKVETLPTALLRKIFHFVYYVLEVGPSKATEAARLGPRAQALLGQFICWPLLGPGPCWAESFVGPCWAPGPVGAIHLLGPVGAIHVLGTLGPILERRGDFQYVLSCFANVVDRSRNSPMYKRSPLPKRKTKCVQKPWRF